MATSSATVATPSATANWTANLNALGLYYEGLVEDIDTLLEMHKLCTVTTYGTRRSRRQAQSTIESSDENSEQIQNEEEKTRRGEDEENVSNKTLLNTT